MGLALWQESSVVAPGPALWSLEMSTESTHGNPAHTWWQNTTHCTTVQFLHQYCWGLSWSILMLQISCCCYQYDDLRALYSDLNKSVLSSENKAVYGMVEKSCHNHSGLLRERKMLPGLDHSVLTLEMHPASLLFEWNDMNTAMVTFLHNKQVHFVAPNIVFLLQKPLARKSFSPEAKRTRKSTTKYQKR